MAGDLHRIFKAYDIRGVYPSELDDESALRVGRAFAEWSGAPKVLVGPPNPVCVLLSVPASSLRPNARCGLTGGCPASAISICRKMKSRSTRSKVTGMTVFPVHGVLIRQLSVV